ncbi:MAG TPA: protein translocase subunit SecD, partial [Prosthecobacter sp.]|nr:protein translocase subunit SecD [Prosthecobacter sp.]
MDSILTFLAGAAILLLLLFYVGTSAHASKRWIGTILTLLATLCAIVTVQKMQIKLGIDLQGGSEFVVQLQPGVTDDGSQKEVSADSIQQAIGILERRLNPDGQVDLLLAPQGTDRILIQMPGVKAEDVEAVRQKIQQVAHLEFRIVPPEGKEALAKFEATGLEDPRFTRMPYKDRTEGAEMLRKRADVEGKHVKRATPYYDAEGWKVSLEFDSTGAKLFDEVAAVNQGRNLAIIVDGEIISAPRLLTDHYGGRAEISGSSDKPFKEQEVRTLASLLENPLDIPMKILSESAVSASYGQSSIDQGKIVCIGGLILTTLFMVFIYRAAGLVAVVGLVVNLTLLFGAMALFQFTLTMPGIAGIVLTIGMAVDANVLIYERLREEMEAGKTFSAALDAAYDKAFSAIADSNITTLISAVILFIIAGGLVKGFAVTLMIGLVSSMIGALVVTRVIFMWVVDKKILKGFSATRIIPNKVFDILSRAKGFIIASLVITAISFATLAVKGKNSFGIDFRGGALTHIELNPGKNIEDGELEGFLKGLKLPDNKPIGTVYVQRKAVTGATVLSVRSEFDAGPIIKEAVESKYKDAVKGASYERVGSIIGGETA